MPNSKLAYMNVVAITNAENTCLLGNEFPSFSFFIIGS